MRASALFGMLPSRLSGESSSAPAIRCGESVPLIWMLCWTSSCSFAPSARCFSRP